MERRKNIDFFDLEFTTKDVKGPINRWVKDGDYSYSGHFNAPLPENLRDFTKKLKIKIDGNYYYILDVKGNGTVRNSVTLDSIVYTGRVQEILDTFYAVNNEPQFVTKEGYLVTTDNTKINISDIRNITDISFNISSDYLYQSKFSSKSHGWTGTYNEDGTLRNHSVVNGSSDRYAYSPILNLKEYIGKKVWIQAYMRAYLLEAQEYATLEIWDENLNDWIILKQFTGTDTYYDLFVDISSYIRLDNYHIQFRQSITEDEDNLSSLTSDEYCYIYRFEITDQIIFADDFLGPKANHNPIWIGDNQEYIDNFHNHRNNWSYAYINSDYPQVLSPIIDTTSWIGKNIFIDFKIQTSATSVTGTYTLFEIYDAKYDRWITLGYSSPNTNYTYKSLDVTSCISGNNTTQFRFRIVSPDGSSVDTQYAYLHYIKLYHAKYNKAWGYNNLHGWSGLWTHRSVQNNHAYVYVRGDQKVAESPTFDTTSFAHYPKMVIRANGYNSALEETWATAVTDGWVYGVLFDNGTKTFHNPFNSTTARIYDIENNVIITPSGTYPGGGAYHSGVLLDDGRIFCIPFNSTTARIYDPSTDTTITPSGTYPGSSAYVGGTLLNDGRVFCIPYNVTTARIYDPSTDTTITPSGVYPGSAAYVDGVLLNDGRVFCIPSSATTARIYDPVTDTLSTPSGTYPGSPGSLAFWGGVLLNDGRVFCVPHNATTSRIYDPSTDTVTTPSGVYPGSSAYRGGVLLNGGRVFCIPFNATYAMIYDPSTDTVTTPSGIYPGSNTSQNGALLPDGRVIMFASRTGNNFIYDPSTDILEQLPLERVDLNIIPENTKVKESAVLLPTTTAATRFSDQTDKVNNPFHLNLELTNSSIDTGDNGYLNDIQILPALYFEDFQSYNTCGWTYYSGAVGYIYVRGDSPTGLSPIIDTTSWSGYNLFVETDFYANALEAGKYANLDVWTESTNGWHTLIQATGTLREFRLKDITPYINKLNGDKIRFRLQLTGSSLGTGDGAYIYEIGVYPFIDSNDFFKHNSFSEVTDGWLDGVLFDNNTKLFRVGYGSATSKIINLETGDIKSIDTPQYHIGGVELDDGRLFICPHYSSGIAYIYDPSNDTITTPVGSYPSLGFRGCVKLNDGRVFLVPHSSTYAMIYDPETNTVSTPSGTYPGTTKFCTGTKLNDGRVFCSPWDSTYAVIYDPINNVLVTATGTYPGNDSYTGCVKLNDGRIFCVPYSATYAIIYDPSTDTVTTPSGTYAGGGAFNGGVLLNDGRVFCIPQMSTTARIYDPSNDTLITPTGSYSGTYSFYCGTLLPNGKVYLFARRSSFDAIYDPVEDKLTYLNDYEGWSGNPLSDGTNNGYYYIRGDYPEAYSPIYDTTQYGNEELWICFDINGSSSANYQNVRFEVYDKATDSWIVIGAVQATRQKFYRNITKYSSNQLQFRLSFDKDSYAAYTTSIYGYLYYFKLFTGIYASSFDIRYDTDWSGCASQATAGTSNYLRGELDLRTYSPPIDLTEYVGRNDVYVVYNYNSATLEDGERFHTEIWNTNTSKWDVLYPTGSTGSYSSVLAFNISKYININPIVKFRTALYCNSGSTDDIGRLYDFRISPLIYYQHFWPGYKLDWSGYYDNTQLNQYSLVQYNSYFGEESQYSYLDKIFDLILYEGKKVYCYNTLISTGLPTYGYHELQIWDKNTNNWITINVSQNNTSTRYSDISDYISDEVKFRHRLIGCAVLTTASGQVTEFNISPFIQHCYQNKEALNITEFPSINNTSRDIDFNINNNKNFLATDSIVIQQDVVTIGPFDWSEFIGQSYWITCDVEGYSLDTNEYGVIEIYDKNSDTWIELYRGQNTASKCYKNISQYISNNVKFRQRIITTDGHSPDFSDVFVLKKLYIDEMLYEEYFTQSGNGWTGYWVTTTTAGYCYIRGDYPSAYSPTFDFSSYSGKKVYLEADIQPTALEGGKVLRLQIWDKITSDWVNLISVVHNVREMRYVDISQYMNDTVAFRFVLQGTALDTTDICYLYSIRVFPSQYCHDYQTVKHGWDGAWVSNNIKFGHRFALIAPYVEPGWFTSITDGWAGGTILNDGRIFHAPLAGTVGKIYDLNTNKLRNTKAIFSTSQVHNVVTLNDGRLYCIPYGGGVAAIYDPVTDTITTPSGSFPASIISGVLLPDGRVYCSPYAATTSRIYDPSTDTLSTPSGTFSGIANAFYGNALLNDGRVFISPLYSTIAMIYNPSNDTLITAGGTYPGGSTGAMYGCVKLNDGRIFTIPYQSTTARIYDPITNSVSTPSGSYPGGGAYVSGVLLNDGRVFIIPYVATTARIYDPITDTTITPSGTYPGGSAFWKGELLPDGRVYMFPRRTQVPAIYDPQLDTLKFLDCDFEDSPNARRVISPIFNFSTYKDWNVWGDFRILGSGTSSGTSYPTLFIQQTDNKSKEYYLACEANVVDIRNAGFNIAPLFDKELQFKFQWGDLSNPRYSSTTPYGRLYEILLHDVIYTNCFSHPTISERCWDGIYDQDNTWRGYSYVVGTEAYASKSPVFDLDYLKNTGRKVFVFIDTGGAALDDSDRGVLYIYDKYHDEWVTLFRWNATRTQYYAEITSYLSDSVQFKHTVDRSTNYASDTADHSYLYRIKIFESPFCHDCGNSRPNPNWSGYWASIYYDYSHPYNYVRGDGNHYYSESPTYDLAGLLDVRGNQEIYLYSNMQGTGLGSGERNTVQVYNNDTDQWETILKNGNVSANVSNKITNLTSSHTKFRHTLLSSASSSKYGYCGNFLVIPRYSHETFYDDTDLMNSVTDGYVGGVLFDNGKKVFHIPYNATIGRITNLETGIVTTPSGTYPGTISFVRGVLLDDGRIFISPLYSTTARIYDPSTDTLNTPSGTYPGDASGLMYGCVKLNDGRIFTIPFNATTARIYDPSTDTTITPSGTYPGSNAYAGGTLLNDGRVFCIPYSATTARIYDPSTDTVTTPSGTYPGSEAFLDGVLLNDGRVFCIPYSATTARIYDPSTNTLSIPSGSYPGNSAFRSGVLLNDGRVFCIPYNSTSARIYDPSTNTLSIPSGSYPGNSAFENGALLPDGRVIMFARRASFNAIYDPSTNTLSYFKKHRWTEPNHHTNSYVYLTGPAPNHITYSPIYDMSAEIGKTTQIVYNIESNSLETGEYIILEIWNKSTSEWIQGPHVFNTSSSIYYDITDYLSDEVQFRCRLVDANGGTSALQSTDYGYLRSFQIMQWPHATSFHDNYHGWTGQFDSDYSTLNYAYVTGEYPNAESPVIDCTSYMNSNQKIYTSFKLQGSGLTTAGWVRLQIYENKINSWRTIAWVQNETRTLVYEITDTVRRNNGELRIRLNYISYYNNYESTRLGYLYNITVYCGLQIRWDLFYTNYDTFAWDGYAAERATTSGNITIRGDYPVVYTPVMDLSPYNGTKCIIRTNLGVSGLETTKFLLVEICDNDEDDWVILAYINSNNWYVFDISDYCTDKVRVRFRLMSPVSGVGVDTSDYGYIYFFEIIPRVVYHEDFHYRYDNDWTGIFNKEELREHGNAFQLIRPDNADLNEMKSPIIDCSSIESNKLLTYQMNYQMVNPETDDVTVVEIWDKDNNEWVTLSHSNGTAVITNSNITSFKSDELQYRISVKGSPDYADTAYLYYIAQLQSLLRSDISRNGKSDNWISRWANNYNTDGNYCIAYVRGDNSIRYNSSEAISGEFDLSKYIDLNIYIHVDLKCGRLEGDKHIELQIYDTTSWHTLLSYGPYTTETQHQITNIAIPNEYLRENNKFKFCLLGTNLDVSDYGMLYRLTIIAFPYSDHFQYNTGWTGYDPTSGTIDDSTIKVNLTYPEAISPTLDLSNYKDDVVNCQFYYTGANLDSGEYGALDIWNGTEWIQLGTWVNTTSNMIVDVGQYLNSETKFRLRTNANLAGEYAGLDYIILKTDIIRPRVLLSFDNRNSWVYWDGSSWIKTSLDRIDIDGMRYHVITNLTVEQFFSSNAFNEMSEYINVAISSNMVWNQDLSSKEMKELQIRFTGKRTVPVNQLKHYFNINNIGSNDFTQIY